MARTGLNDGLGEEEVIAGSKAGLAGQNAYFNGSVTTTSQISGANIYSTGTLVAATLSGTSTLAVGGAATFATTAGFTGAVSLNSTGSVAGALRVGSTVFVPYTQGVVINNIPAEAIISGGMWCTGSAASGTSTTPVIIAGIGNGYPLGICLATTASGASPSVLTRGYYKGLIAETTVSVGTPIAAGAGGALNCVMSGTAVFHRGTVLMAAGSEGTTSVYLF